MIVSQTFNVYQKTFTLFAATGVILAAIYMLHAVLKIFWGPLDNEKNQKLTDLTTREKWILAPLVVLVFWIGVVPGFFLHPMEASVDQFMTTWNQRAIVAFQNDERRILEGGLAAPEEEEAEPAEGEQAAADADAEGGAG